MLAVLLNVKTDRCHDVRVCWETANYAVYTNKICGAPYTRQQKISMRLAKHCTITQTNDNWNRCCDQRDRRRCRCGSEAGENGKTAPAESERQRRICENLLCLYRAILKPRTHTKSLTRTCDDSRDVLRVSFVKVSLGD